MVGRAYCDIFNLAIEEIKAQPGSRSSIDRLPSQYLESFYIDQVLGLDLSEISLF